MATPTDSGTATTSAVAFPPAATAWDAQGNPVQPAQAASSTYSPAAGLITPGNINLYNRPKIPNPEQGGKLSTIYSTSFGENGKEILVPRAADGKILSEKEAEDRYHRTGEHLGIFDNPEHATTYAEQLHNDYESGKYNGQLPTTTAPQGSQPTAWDAQGNPVQHAGNGNTGSIYQATPEEQTEAGSKTAIARREAQHPIITAFGKASGQVLGDVGDALNPVNIAKAAWNSFPPVAAYTSIANAAPILKAYEAARSAGKGIMDSLAVANEVAKQRDSAHQILEQRVDEFKKAPGQASIRALGDAAVLASTFFEAPEELAARSSAPAVSAEAAEAVPKPIAKPVPANPVEAQVGKAIGKAGIAEGTPETAEATTEIGTAPSGEHIQPDLEKGIHTLAEKASAEEAAPYKQAASVREALPSASRNIESQAKSVYAQFDEASGGRWQRFDDALKNIQRKMSEVNGIDDDAYAKLEEKRNDIETSQAQLIEDLRESGKVDPDAINEAVAKYKHAMALNDIGDDIKASTAPKVVNGKVTNVTDPNALAKRLAKRADIPAHGGTPRLEQALGKEGANALTDHVQAAQIAQQEIKDFVPSKTVTPAQAATGQEALTKMVQAHTDVKSALVGQPKGVTNWSAVRNDFERMSSAEQIQKFGDDVPRLRAYINQQVRRQGAKQLLKRGVQIGAGAAVGAAVYQLGKEILNPQ